MKTFTRMTHASFYPEQGTMWGKRMTTDQCDVVIASSCTMAAGTPKASYCAQDGTICALTSTNGLSNCADDAECVHHKSYVVCCSSAKAMIKSHCDGVDAATLEASVSVLRPFFVHFRIYKPV